MSRAEPFARLPSDVTLTLAEVADVLDALDTGVALTIPGGEDHRVMRRAVRVLTGKLWPELGELLDGEE